jgi:hypothetical protein
MPGYLVAAASPLNPFTPSGSISATTVQDAIVELDNEKEKGIPFSPTAPASPTAGDLWIDSSIMQLKTFNGSLWVTLGVATDDSDLVISHRVYG